VNKQRAVVDLEIIFGQAKVLLQKSFPDRTLLHEHRFDVGSVRQRNAFLQKDPFQLSLGDGVGSHIRISDYLDVVRKRIRIHRYKDCQPGGNEE
jgi:hypothetical protein